MVNAVSVRETLYDIDQGGFIHMKCPRTLEIDFVRHEVAGQCHFRMLEQVPKGSADSLQMQILIRNTKKIENPGQHNKIVVPGHVFNVTDLLKNGIREILPAFNNEFGHQIHAGIANVFEVIAKVRPQVAKAATKVE